MEWRGGGRVDVPGLALVLALGCSPASSTPGSGSSTGDGADATSSGEGSPPTSSSAGSTTGEAPPPEVPSACDPRFVVDGPPLSRRWRSVPSVPWAIGHRATGWGVAVDAAGDAYLASDVLLFSEFPADSDGLVVALGPDGTARWDDRYVGAAGLADELRDATIDAAGNLLVAGTEQTQLVDWGDGEPSAEYDTAIVVLSHGPDGERRWRQRLSDPEARWVSGPRIAVGPNGRIVVAYDVHAVGGWPQPVVAELTSGGELVEIRTHAYADYRSARVAGVAIDADGSVYLVAHGQPLMSLQEHVLTFRWDDRGVLRWREAVPLSNPEAHGLVALGDGVVVLASQHSASGREPWVRPWLRRYDRTGRPRWTLDLEAARGDVLPHAIAVDCASELTVLGVVSAQPWLGRISSDGTVLGEWVLSDVPDDRYRDLATDPGGNLVLVGTSCPEAADCRVVALGLAR